MTLRERHALRLAFGETMLLVPWHAVSRDLDGGRARALLRAAFEDADSAASLRELARAHGGQVGLDDAAVIERLAGLLTSGSLVLVQLPADELGGVPRALGRHDDVDDAPRLADLRPRAELAWIELRCVGARGESYAG